MLSILSGDATIGQGVFALLGAWAGWMTGRACAQTWRPQLTLVVYLLILGVAVRFIHFALFGESLTSLPRYLVDTTLLLAVGVVGYHYTRTNQMVTQYHWLYERASPLTFRPKP